jgi:hypothetical protein
LGGSGCVHVHLPAKGEKVTFMQQWCPLTPGGCYLRRLVTGSSDRASARSLFFTAAHQWDHRRAFVQQQGFPRTRRDNHGQAAARLPSWDSGAVQGKVLRVHGTCARLGAVCLTCRAASSCMAPSRPEALARQALCRVCRVCRVFFEKTLWEESQLAEGAEK